MTINEIRAHLDKAAARAEFTHEAMCDQYGESHPDTITARDEADALLDAWQAVDGVLGARAKKAAA